MTAAIMRVRDRQTCFSFFKNNTVNVIIARINYIQRITFWMEMMSSHFWKFFSKNISLKLIGQLLIGGFTGLDQMM